MVEDGQFTWPLPFWEQPAYRWTAMLDAGVRAAFVASSHAARIMLPRRSGFIVNISILGRSETHRQRHLRRLESRYG